MTARVRTSLKAQFETNDVPTQSDYEDVFDSFVSLTDTTSQTVQRPLLLTGTSVYVASQLRAYTVQSSSSAHFQKLEAVTASITNLHAEVSFRTTFASAVPDGLTQGSAHAMTTPGVVISATALGNAVRLPFGSTAAGQHCYVANRGNASARVFPATGQNHDELAANVAVTIAPHSIAGFAFVTNQGWYRKY
jgi:hypothetical protein